MSLAITAPAHSANPAPSSSLIATLCAYVGVLFLAPLLAIAASDIPNSQDHPLLPRFPNSQITEYERAHTKVEMAVGRRDGEPVYQGIEGVTTKILYTHNGVGASGALPTPAQIMRSYQSAAKAAGGFVVYDRLPGAEDAGETTLKLKSGGRVIWVRVEPSATDARNHQVAIVEADPLR